MEKPILIIIAHSQYQYDKCQRYLNGDVPIKDMYPLMVTYYNEIRHLYNGRDINTTPDEEAAFQFCSHIKPPTNE